VRYILISDFNIRYVGSQTIENHIDGVQGPRVR